MARQAMTPERMAAGKEYVEALEYSGFAPEAAFWIDDRVLDEMRLCLVSSLIERVGAKRVYDVLFVAYDASILPRTIDPWIVELFTSTSTFARTFKGQMSFSISEMRVTGPDAHRINIDPEGWKVIQDVGVFKESWVYTNRLDRPIPESRPQLARWKAFEQRVLALAPPVETPRLQGS